MARRYEAGESFAAIARDLGVSKAAVSKAVRRNGGTPRGRGSHSFPGLKERAASVRVRYEQGERLADIAADLGLSFATVKVDLKYAGGKTQTELGVKRRPMRGPANPSWRGGSHITPTGYRMVWIASDDPMASMAQSRKNYVLEHRIVIARVIGRPLLRTESVHHINGDKLDNRPENLQLRGWAHGPGVAMRCHDCGSQNVGAVSL